MNPFSTYQPKKLYDKCELLLMFLQQIMQLLSYLK